MADTETQVANGTFNTAVEDGDDAETKARKPLSDLCVPAFDTSFLGNLAHEAKSG
jgi:hypothetical protein